MAQYAQVIFNNPVRQAFTYEIPKELASLTQVGVRVSAPFGARASELGFVVGLGDHADIPSKKLKKIRSVLDEQPVISGLLLDLLRWLSEYYLCSLGEAIFTAFPFGSRTSTRRLRALIRGPKFSVFFSDPRLTPKRKKTLEYFRTLGAGRSMAQVKESVGVSAGVVNALVEMGALEWKEVDVRTKVSAAEELYQSPRPELNDGQSIALSQIEKGIEEEVFKQFLLHGVTGSGKTEVYLFAIEKILRKGKSALVLVPEIALTPQTAARYRGRFPGQVEVLHSGLSASNRFEAWLRVRAGEAQVVVGTRSAVFAPLPNLGLIVVDEEHDPSYKQADPTPRYHARDVAVYRAMIENAVAVLGSATPSLESYENVARGKARLVELPQRATTHHLPLVNLVDMRGRPPSERILSFEAREAVSETTRMGLQSILFLNRRGHSTQLSCGECGKSLECENCSVAMVWHASDQTLRCHYCSYKCSEPEKCPSCHSEWVRARGYGTEQVVEVIEAFLPTARIGRLDLDTTRQSDSHDKILAQLRRKEIDILVGTQMVSKGLDMPDVRLVVVVQAETALNIADFRAAERSFALLTQVAGRAGRGEAPGRVLIQSYQPSHYSIRCALDHDYKSFRRRERRIRGRLRLPPHARLVNFRAEGEDGAKTRETLQKIADVFSQVLLKKPEFEGSRLIGPTPCPLERLHSRYRWQFLLATPNDLLRRAILRRPEIESCLMNPPSKVKLIVDTDPINLL